MTRAEQIAKGLRPLSAEEIAQAVIRHRFARMRDAVLWQPPTPVDQWSQAKCTHFLVVAVEQQVARGHLEQRVIGPILDRLKKLLQQKG